jgi:hypothetical protein
MADRLVPFAQARFYLSPPTPDSIRLLQIGYSYLASIEIQSFLGVGVCSSVAWGNATPTSDVDFQIIVPDGAAVCREKREFRGEFVDHFEWQESEIETAIAHFVEDPLCQPVGSYSLAFPLILLDETGQLTAARRKLAPEICKSAEAKRWIRVSLRRAERIAASLGEALDAGAPDRMAGGRWQCIYHIADALLHIMPGGHCGQWSHRLRQLAEEKQEAWLIESAVEILVPQGLDLQALASVIEPLADLHRASGAPPRAAGIGAGPPNARYFARKAGYYRALEDTLSLLCVLDRQLGYVKANIAAKRAAAPESLSLLHLTAELERIEDRLTDAWPRTSISHWASSIETLQEYFCRVVEYLGADLRLPQTHGVFQEPPEDGGPRC